MIDPKELIGKLTVEELCDTAEEYYKNQADINYLLAKPFYNQIEIPEMLQTMGILLSGLYLGKTMKVLDFGAGSCWFSRLLNQMQCQTISTDASKTALEIGKRLFREHPIVGEYVAEPVFLPFDGRRIDLPDESVDRIICYDVFHHVPNQEEILAEFGRVLKRGGIVGFSEPGEAHSQTPNSQFMMKSYAVLENDIDVDEIFGMAKRYGFTDIFLKLVVCKGRITLDDYHNIVAPRGPLVTRFRRALKTAAKVRENLRATMTSQTVFFLHKGPYVPDSRDIYGLAYALRLEKREFAIKVGEALSFSVQVQNTGSAVWLTDNVKGIGIVKVGSRLFDANGHLLRADFSRHQFDKNILPGETAQSQVSLSFPEKGQYTVAFDLVSEGVCWFETFGSTPQSIMVTVG